MKLPYPIILTIFFIRRNIVAPKAVLNFHKVTQVRNMSRVMKYIVWQRIEFLLDFMVFEIFTPYIYR